MIRSVLSYQINALDWVFEEKTSLGTKQGLIQVLTLLAAIFCISFYSFFLLGISWRIQPSGDSFEVVI